MQNVVVHSRCAYARAARDGIVLNSKEMINQFTRRTALGGAQLRLITFLRRNCISNASFELQREILKNDLSKVPPLRSIDRTPLIVSVQSYCSKKCFKYKLFFFRFPYKIEQLKVYRVGAKTYFFCFARYNAITTPEYLLVNYCHLWFFYFYFYFVIFFKKAYVIIRNNCD